MGKRDGQLTGVQAAMPVKYSNPLSSFQIWANSHVQNYGFEIKAQTVLDIFPSLSTSFMPFEPYQVNTGNMGLPSKDLIISLISKTDIQVENTRGVLVRRE